MKPSFRQSNSIAIAIIMLALFGLGWVVYAFLPFGYDWEHFFRPAALELLHGRSPYIPGFYNPPWLLIPLIPLAILPVRLGYAILVVLAVGSIGYTAYRLGAKPLTMLLILISYPMLFCIYQGQVDWIIPLGFIMPPWLGLFFVLAKPQLGIGLALFWLVGAWRMGGLPAVFRRFLPIGIAFLLSFLIYGLYLIPAGDVVGQSWDTGLFPMAIPFGIVLMIISIRSERANLAIMAGPLLAPYVAGYSWAVPAMGLLPLQLETIVFLLLFWLVRPGLS